MPACCWSSMAARTAASSIALSSACVIRPDSNRFRAATNSGGRRRLPTTSARHVLWSCEMMSALLGQHSGGHSESAVGGRHATVDRRVEQDLFQLVGGHTGPARRADVKSQLLIAIQGDEERDRDA